MRRESRDWKRKAAQFARGDVEEERYGRHGPPKETMSEVLTPERALDAIALITAKVTSAPNEFDIPSDDLAALGSAHSQLATAFQNQKLSAADFHNKVAIKDDALGTAGGILGAVAKVALSSGASDADLRLIGLARPAKPVRSFALAGPTGLLATGMSDFRTKLAWDRNGLAQGTTFEIFASATGLDADYAIVATTTRASFTMDAPPANAAAWYKIRAARGGLTSPFSNVATVSAPSASGGLRVVEGGKAA